MIPPAAADCDDCVPGYLKRSGGLASLFSAAPFILTFVTVTILIQSKVYPLLSSDGPHSNSIRGSARASKVNQHTGGVSRRRIVESLPSVVFSFTIALSVVLIELLLCEISNSFDPISRRVALQVTVTSLLLLLVVAIPLIEIHSVLSTSGWKLVDKANGRSRWAWAIESGCYGVFLMCFWTLGQLLPFTTATKTILEGLGPRGMGQACLERLGVAGISLMGLLSGFASTSAIWHNFGIRSRPVTEADLDRKRAGLDATAEMLEGKRKRLQQLEHKLAGLPAQGFWSKTVGSIRGNPDLQERNMLYMEVSGLVTMSASLSASLAVLESRRRDQLRSQNAVGRTEIAFSYLFSCYCVYRVIAASIAISRRVFLVSAAVSSTGTESDPVTNTIAIFARNIYPSLDRASWARQISFFLSGVMLLASFSAVLQTFHLFSRFTPGLLSATKSNFALIIAQISGMYVISSALMMRGMMPKELGGVISDALGVGILEPIWASQWFDGVFMAAVVSTAAGIWLGRKLGGKGDWDDEDWDGDVEMGKRL